MRATQTTLVIAALVLSLAATGAGTAALVCHGPFHVDGDFDPSTGACTNLDMSCGTEYVANVTITIGATSCSAKYYCCKDPQ